MRDSITTRIDDAPIRSLVPVSQVHEARKAFRRLPLTFEVQLHTNDPCAGFNLCADITQTGLTIKGASYHANGVFYLRLSDDGYTDPVTLERVFQAHDAVTIVRWTNVVGTPA
ncbi:MAG: hypothetical protein ABJK89_07475 [Paracoccaceae bacterium]